jgi:uncharacterized protein YuzE
VGDEEGFPSIGSPADVWRHIVFGEVTVGRDGAAVFVSVESECSWVRAGAVARPGACDDASMRVTYDAAADMGYIYLVDEIKPGEAVRQVIAGEDEAFVLDLDAQGRLLGIEVFGAGTQLHPNLLAIAERIDRVE